MSTRKKKALGKGLSAMLGQSSAPPGSREEAASLREMPLDRIRPGRYQPRSVMDPDKLEELAESIRTQGVVQPVVVRPLEDSGEFELIAGERRWRAAHKAGLDRIPAVVREVPDEVTLALALIENIQREDLNPLEEAAALKRLIEEFELTHEQAARNVGRSRAAVSNLLRLLELAPEVRELVDQRQLDMGHARALLGLPREDQLSIARRAAREELSVRQTEQLVKRIRDGDTGKSPATSKPADPDIQRLEQQLGDELCAPVSLRHAASGKGTLQIRYTSVDELEGILQRIRGRG